MQWILLLWTVIAMLRIQTNYVPLNPSYETLQRDNNGVNKFVWQKSESLHNFFL